MTAHSYRHILSFLFATVFIIASGCTKEAPPEPLAIGKPVFSSIRATAPHLISGFEITVRAPSIAAWNASLRKDPSGQWRVLSRSDLTTIEAGGELADQKLVAHFLEILSTFATEGEAGPGDESVFGFQPFRLEVRFGQGQNRQVIRLGDPTGPNSIYFRTGENNSQTWIGRGALIAFLPTVQSPDAFIQKRPFAMVDDEVRELELEKTQEPESGKWRFSRAEGAWKEAGKKISTEKAAILERLFRQRMVKTVAESRLTLDKPDWILTFHSASTEEKLTISFELNRILGRNPTRSPETLEFYPEFAGALRAFTQARFTPLKSTSK